MISLPDLDVSRETLDELDQYAGLLRKWNPRINLVSPQTIADLEQRHLADSAQLFRHRHSEGAWADLGAGGGLPGIVLAILAKAQAPSLEVTLVESDRRKAAFLRQCAQALALPVRIEAARIEALPPLRARTLSARALAPLSDLLAHAERHLAAGGRAVFPKGERWREEVEIARRMWSFSLTPVPSETQPGAAILIIEDIARV